MKQLAFSLKQGFARILVESKDDLWYLTQIIDPSDQVKARTFRKIKVGSAEKDSIRKPMTLIISVEKVEFEGPQLRISGKVVEGTEEVSSGSYHSITVEENTTLTITKPQWYGYQIARLKEATETAPPKIVICVFDREEAFFALLKRDGYEFLAHFRGDVQKKRVDQKVKSEFYEQVIAQLEQYDSRFGLNRIILASPAFWKEELFKVLSNNSLKAKIVQATCSSVDESAITEVMRRKEVETAIKAVRVSDELLVVNSLLEEIRKGGKAAYGIKNVSIAVNAGAVDKLLVTDGLIVRLRQEGTFSSIDALMKLVDRTKGHVVIVSSNHDGGKALDGLGGIGAILRYQLPTI